MTDDVPLRTIMPAFQGVIPSPVATVASDGTPNITYVSLVRYLDDERVAVSNQFLSKTTRNLQANPQLTVRVVDPETLREYDLEATRLRSERTGELFDAMRAQIDAIADLTGMSGVFRLRSVEVLRVDRCRLVEGSVGRGRSATTARAGVDAIGVFMTRLDDCRDLDDLTRTALDLLDDVFGIASSMFLVADDAARTLFVIAHHGSTHGVAAEIPFGEGVIGVAAERGRQVLVPHMARARTLNRAAARSNSGTGAEIPLPGLDDAQSVVATPIVRRGRLIGVLYVDAAEPGRFGTDDGQLLDVLARHIGMCVDLLATDVDDIGGDNGRQAERPSADGVARTISFHEPDGTMLIDGDYIIRGVAGRLLFAILSEHQRSGRTRFSNRELRMNKAVGLPVGNDNLDARLVALRRRLAERGDPFQLERAGRGQLELLVASTFALTIVDPAEPAILE